MSSDQNGVATATEIESASVQLETDMTQSARLSQTLAGVLEGIKAKVAPVWPLADYVAINPYSGFSSKGLLEARQSLQSYSACELLMPLSHYAESLQSGRVTTQDIMVALKENADSPWKVGHLGTAGAIEQYVKTHASQPSATPAAATRDFHTIASLIDRRDGTDWCEVIIDAISLHCSAHYDEGQATWTSPWKSLPLYQAWLQSAKIDAQFEWLGVTGFRKFVRDLPHKPEAALLSLLLELGVPKKDWESFLMCQALSMPGWMGYAKYKGITGDRAGVENGDLIGLLAIRLAMDVALSHAMRFEVTGPTPELAFAAPSQEAIDATAADSWVRAILLRAGEVAIQRNLLTQITQANSGKQNVAAGADQPGRRLAQVVFCIDVRSERIRRHLESAAERIETFGFAGFFGLPIEFVRIGQKTGSGQVPVLLTPQVRVLECLRDTNGNEITEVASRRSSLRNWRKTWKQFQISAVSCFSFVETTGLFFVGPLLGRTLRLGKWSATPHADGVCSHDHDRIGPTLRGLHEQGITTSDQADMAAAVLTNAGLTDNFARLVVFCGHGSQTENNPLQAGLDCGACGGHSGESNARFAAMLLNQSSVRQKLAERGLVIPEDTHFLPAVHNTTTDTIEYFDTADLPPTHRNDLNELRQCSESATRLTQAERMPIVASDSLDDLLRRSADWSEVRPEWGLAGNAAFIAAPRSMTDQIDLDGRSFLHSYDETRDPEGAVLETIMTAPLVVAHLINMQYYASTVDQSHFGSGSKTVHNVVGQFGVLSGNTGDLQTGLPMQSLHDGERLRHEPVRLLGIIAAKRSAIDRVLANHPHVAELIVNGWLNLVAIEDGSPFRYDSDGNWESVSVSSLAEAA